MVRSARTVVAAAATAALGVGLAVSSPSSAAPADRLVVTSVSNVRPQLVSGGNVLVEVAVPGGVRPGQVEVTADGRSVRPAFVTQPDGTLRGLVSGLPEGTTKLVAKAPGAQTGRLTVVNHPITGPVFSGPQQRPYFCETEAFGLAPAVQPNCSAPTVVSYQYRSTAGTFKPLANPATRPADLATTTVGTRTVPYVVRIERGTIDRAVYEIAALYDGHDPSPTRASTAWNGALVYTFGGGCNAGYHQGSVTGGVLDDLFLGQGYAVASSTLNVLDTNCSAVISAEAAMMVKEHVVETYGPVRHTIGWGGSGGAIQQYTIADSYPGILDGIVPGVSFPDPITTIGVVTDCRLLKTWFEGEGASFTPAQREAVAGFRSFNTCQSWDAAFANRATATDSCNPAVPAAARWDAVTNPGGVRCQYLEQLVNQIGRNPSTGFVRSPLDNTGVAYGLSALADGTISPQQFVDLNAGIGGLDTQGRPQAARSAADPAALEAVYATDLVNSASLGLRSTPVIDQRTDLDLAPDFGDIHTTEWSFVIRERLLRATGSHGNQVIIETGTDPATVGAASAYQLDAMERWLTKIGPAGAQRPSVAKVDRTRPRDLADGCYLSATRRIKEPLTYPSSGRCGELFPVAANPRLVAGQSLDLMGLACERMPLDFAAYPVQFTPAQQATLRQTFPTGVCDLGRPGLGQRAPIGAWLGYGTTSLTAPTPID